MIMANNSNKNKCNVPHLRFPEFTEEWKKIRLDSFTERVMRKNKTTCPNCPLPFQLNMV